MKRLWKAICFTIVLPSLMAAQSTTQDHPAESNVALEIQKLREKMEAQDKLLAKQQQEIQNLKVELNQRPQPVSSGSESGSPRVVNAVMRTSDAASSEPAETVPAAPRPERSKESPLSFHIGGPEGGADFTPGGFVDFTSIFRTSNTGSIGTSFGTIPFNNTVAEHLTESRFTAQNSRVSLNVHSLVGENDVTGYVEMDFLGNDAGNVFVTSNSHTLRSRLYYVDLKRDKWEILGGQAWSWLTPNRVGLSATPKDVFYTQNIDFNYQVGLTWTRAPQFRVAYHPTGHWALGVAVENPQQYVGANEITYPYAFNAQLGSQLDSGSNPGTPNVHPDIIPKVAYDTDWNGKHLHLEAAGLLTSLKITTLPVGGTGFVRHTKTGGGVEAAANVEFVKNIRFVASGFYSDGGGRYIFGLGPDTVVRPNAAGTDADLSLVHSGSGVLGVEAQVAPKTLFSAYYGGAYFQRNSFLDTTSPRVVKPIIGFGGGNSSNSNNRALQEGTFGWTQTFWKDPEYGALQLITQYSYVTRSPWFVAAGAPKNAHLSMVWLDLRYVIP